MININQKNVSERTRFLISFGMTKKDCHCEATKLPWQSHYWLQPKKSSRACQRQAWWSHIDYNRKAVIAR